MISQRSSISSSNYNQKNILKEKDYDLLHYFDDQSDNETEKEKDKKNDKKPKRKTSLFKENDIFSVDNSFSLDDSKEEKENKEDDYFDLEENSVYDYNEKVVELSPDGNFGRYDELIFIFSNKAVYKGYDYNGGREIVWCEIRLNKNNPNITINNISNQINLLKSIKQNDNILKYINSWYSISNGKYVVIQELCNGGNINSNYKYIQKPKIKLIKKWIKEILKGLDFLHTNKIIHHDIKCENIFLDRLSGHLKIGCIGNIEQLQPGSDNFEKYLGTPEFMAPEVNEGNYSFKSNIYSLGLTLIELLTVQIPYKECEGALKIYINKQKGIMPESLKLITDKGIKDFITLCLSKESKRPTAKELLEKNEWLNDKSANQNNSIIHINGSLRQKNFYLNEKYKSGGFLAMKTSNVCGKNIVIYNSKLFKTFNLKSKSSWKMNCHNKSGKLKSNNSMIGNINNEVSSSFSFKNNIVFNKSTASRTDNYISNRSYHNPEDLINEINSNTNNKNIAEDYLSNDSNKNSSREKSTKDLINLDVIKINIVNEDESIVNKPIIKEKNKSNSTYGIAMFQRKKSTSPEQSSHIKKIVIPHLNFGQIQNNQNNNLNRKINSFRESISYQINNINVSSSISSIIMHYNNEDSDESCGFDVDNDYCINYNIIYTIKCVDNRSITCEYNYEKDSVELIIKNLKEIMNIDANDIILLKNEFGKKLHEFMDKKKLQLFFNNYYMVMQRFKILGNTFKKLDKILNDKNIKNYENFLGKEKLNILMEKISDYKEKKTIVNNFNNANININNNCKK